MPTSPKPKYVLYLAVVPIYRDAAIRELINLAKGDLTIYAGQSHLDPTVKTGLPASVVKPVRNTPLLSRRLLLQTGHLCEALNADVCVIDLNPRSITAWALALARKLCGRRTLAWGHLHPRSGGGSRTATIRRALRRLTDGTILYGYDSVVPARNELTDQPVWVAANALYRKEDIQYTHEQKTTILYVGRLEPAKNVDIILKAFELSKLSDQGYVLEIVGFGSLAETLDSQAVALKIDQNFIYHGRIDDVQTLKHIYSRTLFSISPGYIGLSLTQSLGFGTPMLYAQDAPHSPEIELARFGGVKAFRPTTAEGLADGMRAFHNELKSTELDRVHLSAEVSKYYSAQAMAMGLWEALLDRPSQFDASGWPID